MTAGHTIQAAERSFLSESALAVKLDGGRLCSATNGHKVYFATGSTGNLNATLRKIWTTADSRYRASRQAHHIACESGWLLYYCSRNTTTGQSTKLTAPYCGKAPLELYCRRYVNVDDFEDYNSTADLNAVWHRHTLIAVLSGNIYSRTEFVSDSAASTCEFTTTTLTVSLNTLR